MDPGERDDYYREYLATGDPKYLDVHLGTIRPARELAEYLATGKQEDLDAYLGTIKPGSELVEADIRATLGKPDADEPGELEWLPAFLVTVGLALVVALMMFVRVSVPHARTELPQPGPQWCPTTISLAVNPPLTSTNEWLAGDPRKPATLAQMAGMMATIQRVLKVC